MKVHVPTPLRSYTVGSGEVDATGNTLAEILADLDHRYPGMRFRMIDEQGNIREHIRLFVDRELSRDLKAPLIGANEVHIICALSGG